MSPAVLRRPRAEPWRNADVSGISTYFHHVVDASDTSIAAPGDWLVIGESTVVPSIEIQIDGEGFNVLLDAGDVVIQHPQWSLVGIGLTFSDAMASLREEARMLRDAFDDSDKLSAQAKRMRAFVLQDH